MNVILAMTAIQKGAVVANHVEVVDLLKEAKDSKEPGHKLTGARVRDTLTGETWEIKAKVSESTVNIFRTIM
jgi:glycerol-3-phosphate dehydrogenase